MEFLLNSILQYTSMAVKKTKRLHQLYQDWLKITKDTQLVEKLRKSSNSLGFEHGIFDTPLAGKWYYEYHNDKGGYVGLAKLQDLGVQWINGKWGTSRKWIWETCTANEGLELRRFPTQKQAEKEIYKFLS